MADRVGLVVAGAGARGAYEAGALSVLLRTLEGEGASPSVLVGTSAGALNVVALAAYADLGMARAAEEAVGLWSRVTLGDVASVVGSAWRDVRGLGWQLLTGRGRLVSLLDTGKLVEHIRGKLDWERLHRNVREGVVQAVAVVATSSATNATAVFVLRHDRSRRLPDDRMRDITYVDVEELRPEHAVASSAIPVAFRPVLVGEPPDWKGWYVDGGVRVNAPLKPALTLGAGRVAVVATHPDQYPAVRTSLPAPSRRPPDMWGAAGHLLRGALSDRMVEDLHTLAQVNGLAAKRPATGRGKHVVPFVFAGPQSEADAVAIGETAESVFRRNFGGLPRLGRRDLALLSRLVGGTPREHGELLSYLFFDPAFTVKAAELGAEHAGRSRGWQTGY